MDLFVVTEPAYSVDTSVVAPVTVSGKNYPFKGLGSFLAFFFGLGCMGPV